MRTNYFCGDAAQTRRRPYRHAAARKAPPKETGYAVHSGIDDFLKSYPVFTLNQYGERVISGRRIC